MEIVENFKSLDVKNPVIKNLTLLSDEKFSSTYFNHGCYGVMCWTRETGQSVFFVLRHTLWCAPV
ncbi:hypothetical protein JCM15548_13922 [Geofilum rubicundum JCM 15548]|uniref:Uncharacterized protein n=1 Tax=Geofilum rubicundum JCM 15548 TaxID=1236989 RepID=A0A0E9M2E2_9BACT|nr:hypothetical protein JCM15548_13922 [Geofilum rubicundum JCM 15548]